MDRIISFKGNYAFLSSFWDARIEPDWLPLPAVSVEHAYQATKTFHLYEQLSILDPKTTAGQAKRLGRQVTIREDWEDIKLFVMEDLVRLKFTTHPHLERKLLDTDNAELIEGNYWHDQYWGNCNCRKHMYVPGNNYLGTILMKVREQLKTLP